MINIGKIKVIDKEARKPYLYNVGTIKRYGDMYKVSYNFSVKNKGSKPKVEWKRGEQHDKKLDASLRRSRNTIKELALCNPWEYFVTLTVNKDKLDRYDINGYIKKLGQRIRNLNKGREKPITYMLIPEQHKDGAWHMHGFMMGLTNTDIVEMETRKGRKVYHWKDYVEKFGFCDLERIESLEKASSYVTKYVTKDMMKSISEINAKTYYNSKGLERAKVMKKGTVSAKYSPTYEKIIDGELVYSEMWLPTTTTEQDALSYVNNSKDDKGNQEKFTSIVDEDGVLVCDIPLEFI